MVKACDRFIIGTTFPALLVAMAFLPSRAAFALVAATSVWELAALGIVGVPIATERWRRRRQASRPQE